MTAKSQSGSRRRTSGGKKNTPAKQVAEGVNPAGGKKPNKPAAALNGTGQILDRLEGKRLALFLDYDGTLTPIVTRPENAILKGKMREVIRDLADHVFVAIVSGRDLDDVRSMVGLDQLYYAGSHGFDIGGPDGMRMQQQEAKERLPQLEAAERKLRGELEGFAGIRVERKRFALAVHFREAASEDESWIEGVVDGVQREHPELRKKGGKKIFELQPDVSWDKGRAILWLLERLDLTGEDVLPAYIGDDVTDEDAFEALAGHGLTIRVGPADEPTRAEFFLSDIDQLENFLAGLLRWLAGEDGNGG